AEPSILDPVRRAASALGVGANGNGDGTGVGLDPILTVVTVGGLAALVAAAREAAHPFLPEPISSEAWRQHVFDLLVNGVKRARPDGAGDGTRPEV
ncbi:MAG TPA: hypothetical protein VFK90_11050, partial [Anaeromyxobacter sp.]|nr:hypothetical protein [Anaeromyxobacter sp.]